MYIPKSLSHIYSRTLPIKTKAGISSSFVMSYGEQEWLVTANHVVRSRSGVDRDFEVIRPSGPPWAGLERINPTPSPTSHADVAIFQLWKKGLDVGPPLIPYATGPDSIEPLQPVCLLGFPDFGDPKMYTLKPFSPRVPLIRQAVVSGEADDMDMNVWLLDGMDNHGMSGGPAIICDQESGEYRVFGVISSYVPAHAPSTPAEPQGGRPRSVGVAPPSSIDAYFETNSGLAIVYDIKHVVAVIDEKIGGKSAE